MDEMTANPFVIILFFIIRCLIPLAIMLGISYIIRRFGLVTAPPPPPKEPENEADNHQIDTNGGLAHGKS